MKTIGLMALWLAADSTDFVHVCMDGGAGGYEAFPDVCRLKDGRLMCVFYAGYDHVSLPSDKHPNGGAVAACYSSDEGATWSAPTKVYDGPYDDRDPSVVQLPGGRLICNFFSLKPTEGPKRWEGLGTWIVASDDAGATWSEAVCIAPQDYCSSPIRVLSTGRLILGLYRADDAFASGSVVFSDDDGRTWSEVVVIPNGGRRLDAETDVIERPDGSLLAVQRAEKEDMAWSVSTDRGQTWSESRPIGFPGHCPYLHRTRAGVLLLAHRIPNTSLHWSTDEGNSWSENVLIDDRIGAYPSMVDLKDGSVLVVYYEEGPGSNIRARRLSASEKGIRFLPPFRAEDVR